MKIKFLSLAFIALFALACSSEETADLPLDQQSLTTEYQKQSNSSIVEGISGQSRSGGFTCDPNWTPDTLQPFGHYVYEIHYSDDPADWPLGIIDIDCTRQEYFKSICGMFMKPTQPIDPYVDIWVRDMEGCDPTTKDDVVVTSNDDPRVCVGPDCD